MPTFKKNLPKSFSPCEASLFRKLFGKHWNSRCYDHRDVTQGTVSAVLDKMQDERNREIKEEFKLLDAKKEDGKLISLDKNVEIMVGAITQPP